MGSVPVDGDALIRSVVRFLDEHDECAEVHSFLLRLFQLVDRKLEMYETREDMRGYIFFDEDEDL